MVKAMDLHQSHWWWKEGHPAEIAPEHWKSPTLVGTSEPLNKEIIDVKFGYTGCGKIK